MTQTSAASNHWLEYHSASVGEIALQVLSQAQTAAILGTTSRGIFIQSSSRRVLFLSFERYRSPLTITLFGIPPRLRQLETGAAVEIAGGKMIIPAIQTAILTTPETVWHNPAPSEIILPDAQRRAHLSFLAQQVPAEKGDQGLAGLLTVLLDFPGPTLAKEQQSLLINAWWLREAVRVGNTAAALQRVSRFLGLGRGLTPSGDDLALGLSLALNRWHRLLPPRLDLQRFNRRIQELAYQKTTSLSANLIECATAGNSDERITNVLDAIITGKPAPQQCTLDWLQWGASSGIDALVGMSLALT
ncbi:MAG: DUF2877 domain-containing protein [Chloroflexi bacterium]|nr:DUF2877 domain-containing protein [Chloroflexota bacterium]